MRVLKYILILLGIFWIYPQNTFGISIQGNRDTAPNSIKTTSNSNDLERQMLIDKVKAMMHKKNEEKKDRIEESKKQKAQDSQEQIKQDQAERRQRINQDLSKMEQRQDKVKEQLKVLEEQRERLKEKNTIDPKMESVKETGKK
ncbi:MAG: hypothetical protein HQK91_13250 [Nitrospirae bacterium]|nr:hypothetical protein [Nitrospirota bacterium]MBF0542403.1 hypothetical protein [Nitrospirota bacterium]